VTLSILRLVTLCRPSRATGLALFCVLLLLSVIILSQHLLRFNFKLLARAQVSTLPSSISRVSMLLAGMMIYVSSANFVISLPLGTAFRSAALTTYEEGPILEPWIWLAVIS
jgi:hypothetical protein